MRATERLHPPPRRQRYFGDIAVLRTGIDRVVKAFVDLVKPVRISGVAQYPQLLVDSLQPVPLRRRHSLRGKPGAECFELRHRLEHPGQPFDRGPRHHRAAMRPGIDKTAGHQLTQRLAHRRARHLEAPGDVGLVKRRSRRQRAAHDFIRQLQPQFLRARDLVLIGRGAVHAPDHRFGRLAR